MKKFLCLLPLFLAIFFTSCNRALGYSVVLWRLEEENIDAGTVLKVYIKSNISQVYIAGTRAITEKVKFWEKDSQKIEVPLWKLSAPTSKKKALLYAKKLIPYKDLYAKVKLDGLPIRQEALNTSKQVYRLREEEEIKVLYKGAHEEIKAGKNTLSGDWEYCLTQDGTSGWCFSYNLTLFEKVRNAEPLSLGEGEEKSFTFDDKELVVALQNYWYPLYYKKMIEGGVIDTDSLLPNMYLTLEPKTNTLTFNMPPIPNINDKEVLQSWEYQGAKKEETLWHLSSIPLTIELKKNNILIASYLKPDGKEASYTLTTIKGGVEKVLKQEVDKKNAFYNRLYSAGTLYKSRNYGNLTFSEDKKFTWKNKTLLLSAVLGSKGKSAIKQVKDTGEVKLKYVLSGRLKKEFDGSLTLIFEGLPNFPLTFLCKIEEKGLRLQYVNQAKITGSVLEEASSSPLVIYFDTN